MSLTSYSQSHDDEQGLSGLSSTAALLGVMRAVRAWNQTGQKHAGEPDIARNVLPAHNVALWIGVLLTYLFASHRLFRRLSKPAGGLSLAISGLSFWLCFAAFGFKARFTRADAPELLVGLEPWLFESMTQNPIQTQVIQVVACIGVWAISTTFPGHWIPPDSARKSQRAHQ